MHYKCKFLNLNKIF